MVETTSEVKLDRRKNERTKCHRGALLCIPRRKNLFSFSVRDRSARGIGMQLHPGCRLLPVEFMVADEGSWTVQHCRLAWRDGDFAGVAFVD
jgi:hypothetical protein